MNKLPKSRMENIVVQSIDNELLIFDIISNKAFCLNETSTVIWHACDGKTSITEISKIVSQKLKTTSNEDLVWLALEKLENEDLIEKSNYFSNHFAEIPRREVIKKIGLATMAALPVISSVIAPSSILAASCGTAFELDMCSVDRDCVTCCCSIAAPGSRTCIPTLSQAPTSLCFANCQCASNSCIGPLGNLMCS